MRLPALAAVGSAAMALGCAQVAGIEDISSSAAAQHCVDTVNMLRQGAMLAPVARWSDEEECADQIAMFSAQNTGGTLPSCIGGAFPALGYSFQVVDPDTYLPSLVNELWNGDPTHASLAQASLKRVACGYGSTGKAAGGALLLDL